LTQSASEIELDVLECTGACAMAETGNLNFQMGLAISMLLPRLNDVPEHFRTRIAIDLKTRVMESEDHT
jgi:hypothetical protein